MFENIMHSSRHFYNTLKDATYGTANFQFNTVQCKGYIKLAVCINSSALDSYSLGSSIDTVNSPDSTTHILAIRYIQIAGGCMRSSQFFAD